MKWQENYRLGQLVEFRISERCEWVEAKVVRKTRSGKLVVETRGGAFAADVKSDIRPLQPPTASVVLARRPDPKEPSSGPRRWGVVVVLEASRVVVSTHGTALDASVACARASRDRPALRFSLVERFAGYCIGDSWSVPPSVEREQLSHDLGRLTERALEAGFDSAHVARELLDASIALAIVHGEGTVDEQRALYFRAMFARFERAIAHLEIVKTTPEHEQHAALEAWDRAHEVE